MSEADTIEIKERLARIETLLLGRGVPSGDGLLTIVEVAARLGKSRRSVERLVKLGKLRKVPNLGRRTTRFRAVTIERFLCAGEDEPGRRRL